MRTPLIALFVLLFVAGAPAAGFAQEAAPGLTPLPRGVQLRTEAPAEAATPVRLPVAVPVARQAAEPRGIGAYLWDQLWTHPTWIVGVLILLIGLARGDRDAWLFFGLIVAALVTFAVGPEVVERSRSALATWWGVLIATVLLGGVAIGLYALHRASPLVFALTEVAFSLVGIGYAVHKLAQDTSDWAALVVTVYGLHEGIGRFVDARKPEARAAAKKAASANEPSASPTK